MHRNTFRIDEARLRTDFEALAEIGATLTGGINRLALSNEDLQARAWFARCIDEAGLSIRDDDAGNLSGILPGADSDHTLLLGSHLDSVPNGGRYDGSVGVLAALECLRTFKEAGWTPPVNVEVINFTDEEGTWQSLFGSRGLTGKLEPLAHMDRDPGEASAFRAALFRAGIRPSDVHKAVRSPASLVGYLELHIEQGERLYARGAKIGVVSGIVGRTTYQVIFYGEAGHSGTTAPHSRRDALYGGTTFINEAHRFVRQNYPDGLFNCGDIKIKPGLFNVIPDQAQLTIECRHPDQTTLATLESQLIRLSHDIAAERRLSVSVRRTVQMPAASMSEQVMQAIEHGAKVMGVPDDQVMRLISYAGHDAQMMSDFTPSSMIFIPSVNGISHNVKEFTEWEDVVLGANVLLQAVLHLLGQIEQQRQKGTDPR